jgi:FkbM family methyltransferase
MCPQRKIYAFEPFPPVLDILKTNLALSGFAEEIAVVELAVSDKEGVAELFVPTQEHGLVETSASLYSGFKSRHSDIVTTRTVKLDDFIGENDVGRVAVIKIDVEGAEDRVLNGAVELIERDLPVIFCEILKDSRAWPAIEEILTSMGYLRAAVHERALVTEVNQLSADNHILFPKSMEATVRHIALQQMCEMMPFQGHVG